MPVRARRVRTPTILQMEALECGAAALAIVLGHFGRHVSLEELRTLCGVSRDGTKASNLIKAARHFGLKAKGFSVEPEELAELPLPAIVFWNFNHYLVVEGIDRRSVWVNDPALGPRRLSHAEFEEGFTGVVLVFETGEAFSAGGRRGGSIGALLGRLSDSHAAVGFVVLASLALIVPGLAVPAFNRVFVDYVLIEGHADWLPPMLWLMLGAALLRAVVVWVQQNGLLRLETKLAAVASARFFWHVLRLPVRFFDQRAPGEIGQRVALNDRVAMLLGGELATAMLGLTTIALYALVMAQYDAVLTGIGVAFALANLLAVRLVNRGLSDAHQRYLLDHGRLSGSAMQGLQMIETFKASGTENVFFRRWAGHHARAVNAEQRLAWWRALLAALPVLLGGLATATVLLVGGLRVMDGALSIGMLVAFQALMVSFLAPVGQLVNVGGQLQEARGTLVRLDDVMRAPPDPLFAQPGPEPSAAPHAEGMPADSARLSGRVDVEDLSFGYAPLEPPFIDGVTLHLRPGDRVALVGASGSGKSTVGRLIAGLLPASSGSIRFDGVPIEAVPRWSLRTDLAMVDQETAIFQATVRDNITLWDESVPEEAVVAAARDALIHDVVAARPGAYGARLTEAGRNLSGGQRQRIEIARALLNDPRVLILDEATSALDAETEARLMRNLRRRGCTVILIAHRLSTVRDCDEIVVLERGRVVERGTHDELAADGGRYRTLIEA